MLSRLGVSHAFKAPHVSVRKRAVKVYYRGDKHVKTFLASDVDGPPKGPSNQQELVNKSVKILQGACLGFVGASAAAVVSDVADLPESLQLLNAISGGFAGGILGVAWQWYSENTMEGEEVVAIRCLLIGPNLMSKSEVRLPGMQKKDIELKCGKNKQHLEEYLKEICEGIYGGKSNIERVEVCGRNVAGRSPLGQLSLKVALRAYHTIVLVVVVKDVAKVKSDDLNTVEVDD